MASTAPSCTSSGNALRPPTCEQVGGEQRCFVPLLLSNTGDQCVRGRIGQLVEPTLQGGSGCLGIEARRGNAFVAEKTRILLQITGDDGTAGAAEEVAAFEKVTQRLEDLGLSIAEGKELLAAVQHGTVKVQAAAWSRQHRPCPVCDGKRRCKGSYPMVFRMLFGDVELDSPRLHHCQCQDMAAPPPFRRCAT
jgi:hypothetical protein